MVKNDVNMTVIIHHIGRYWTCAIRITSRSNISLSLCLRFTLIKQHLDMCTYNTEKGQIVVPTAVQAEEATHPTATKVEEDERR